MSFASKGTNEILVAGLQDAMFIIDVNRGEIIKQVWAGTHLSLRSLPLLSRFLSRISSRSAALVKCPLTLSRYPPSIIIR